MRAEVASFEWPDLERNGLETSGLNATTLVIVARPVGGQGGETFHLTVCTPDGLSELLDRDGLVVGRHLLFGRKIDVERVEEFILDRLRRLDGGSWRTLAEKIGRLGYWEFEDYSARPDIAAIRARVAGPSK